MPVWMLSFSRVPRCANPDEPHCSEHDDCGDHRPHRERFVSHRPRERQGDHRVHEGIRTDGRRCRHPQQPGVGPEAEHRAGHHQEDECGDTAGRHLLGAPPAELADGCTEREHNRSACCELHGSGLRGRVGPSTLARDDRTDSPAQSAPYQRETFDQTPRPGAVSAGEEPHAHHTEKQTGDYQP
jgi:hypothetical protein